MARQGRMEVEKTGVGGGAGQEVAREAAAVTLVVTVVAALVGLAVVTVAAAVAAVETVDLAAETELETLSLPLQLSTLPRWTQATRQTTVQLRRSVEW